MADTRSTGSAAPDPLSGLAAWLRSAGWPPWEVAALAATTALALVLRLHDYTSAPLFLDNTDELQFAWAGLNLLQHGDPYTWSLFSGYPSWTTFPAFGQTFRMVHHWMDHPPLFSVIVGGWAWLLGDRGMGQVTAAQIRIIPVLASTATVPLAYLLGRPLIGRRASLVGALLLATGPGAVLLGRETEPESLQAVLLLVALLCTRRLVDGAAGRRLSLAVLLVCGAAAPLMKVSGIAVAGICLVILFVFGQRRAALLVGASGVAGLLGFAVYGYVVDWHLFLRIWSQQVGNRQGVLAAFDFIADPTGVNRRLRDGWWLLGWIGIGLLALRHDRRLQLLLVWPAAAYAATMLVLAGGQQVQQYGWYKVIVYPEVYVAAGYLAWTAVRRASLGLLTLLLALGGATATNWLLGGLDQEWVPNPVVLVALFLVVLGPAAWAAWRGEEVGARQTAVTIATLALGAMVFGNAMESLILSFILGRM